MKSWGFLWILAAFAVFLFWAGITPVHAQDGNVTAYADLGNWDCYDDGSMDPCHEDINQVLSGNDYAFWAVGNHGKILRFDGNQFVPMVSPTTLDLHGIVMLSPGDGWIVGGSSDPERPGESIILRWDGLAWNPFPHPPSAGLTKVSFSTPDDGWTISRLGETLHWNGTAWEKVDQPHAATLKAIFALYPHDVWAVGANSASDSLLIHWDGSQWNLVPSPAPYLTFYDIEMVSPTDVWLVGWDWNFYRWNGTDWTMYSYEYPEYGYLRDIQMNSAVDGWAVGDYGAILLWNGVNWLPKSDSSGLSPALHSVSAYSGSGWAVGQGGVIQRWNGSEWLLFRSADPRIYQDIDSSAPDNVWAVGNKGLIKQWVGNAWTDRSLEPQNNTLSISVASPNNVWVGANQQMWQWGGSNWTSYASEGFSFFQVDWDGTEIWSSNSSTECDQDSCWSSSNITQGVISQNFPISNFYLNDLEMLSPSLGWAVGDHNMGVPGPTIYNWDGDSWTSDSAVTNNISKIEASSPDNAWALGLTGLYNNAILRWNGMHWGYQPCPQGLTLTDIDISPQGGVWIAGDSFLHWSGTAWDPLSVPTGNQILGLDMDSNTHGWAVGENSVILEYKIPSLTINHASGAPGSFFNLFGSNFPRNRKAVIHVNGLLLGDIPVNRDGSFAVTLLTDGAEKGLYLATASVDASVTVEFTLDGNAGFHARDGDYPLLPIAYKFVYLPLIKR